MSRNGELKITTKESILLNGVARGSQTTHTINNITKIDNRILTIPENREISIIKFVDGQNNLTAGGFERDKVKYVRITNLNGNNYINLILRKDGDDYYVVKLDKNKSFLLGNSKFETPTDDDYVISPTGSSEPYVDIDYYEILIDLVEIRAKADTSDCNLEYFIALT